MPNGKFSGCCRPPLLLLGGPTVAGSSPVLLACMANRYAAHTQEDAHRGNAEQQARTRCLHGCPIRPRCSPRAGHPNSSRRRCTAVCQSLRLTETDRLGVLGWMRGRLPSGQAEKWPSCLVEVGATHTHGMNWSNRLCCPRSDSLLQ